MSQLITSRNNQLQQLKSCSLSSNVEIEARIQALEEEICALVEDENYKKFTETFGSLIHSEGDTNNSIWKVKRKVFNRNGSTLPSAKLDPSGRLITEQTELKQFVLTNFIQRLRKMPMFPGLEGLMVLKEKLFRLRMEYVNSLPFDPWTEDNLAKVLYSLKKGKSKDPMV